MSEISGTSAAPGSGSTVVTSSSAPTTQAAATAGGGGGGDMNATVNSMQELKEKAPDVYKASLLGLAQNMCSKFKRQQDRLKKLMREGQERR